MKVPMLALRREYEAIQERVESSWVEILDGMRLLKGPNVEAFESEMAAYCGAKSVIGVASGTDALAVSLIASGVGPGDEVLLQANGFIADVEAIRMAGARPVLVDIASEGYGPDLEQLTAAVTSRTRALLVVHLYGEPVELEPLLAFCQSRGIRLIEDASHSHGARLDGRHLGTFGDAGAFSAGVIKNLAAYGDAGFITTDDPEIEREARLLGVHGQAKKNHHVRYGWNSRLDEVQAAVLRAKLPLLEGRNARRREFAAFYSEALLPFCIAVPEPDERRTPAFHQYVVRVADRSRLQAALKERGVETGIHYPTPLHRQPAWEETYGAGLSFPRAEKLASEILSLPIVPDLSWEEVRYVAECFRECAVPGEGALA